MRSQIRTGIGGWFDVLCVTTVTVSFVGQYVMRHRSNSLVCGTVLGMSDANGQKPIY